MDDLGSIAHSGATAPGARAHQPRSTQVTPRIHQSMQPGANVFALSGVWIVKGLEYVRSWIAAKYDGR